MRDNASTTPDFAPLNPGYFFICYFLNATL